MYKLLLCWRYLRTRYIALASIISVTLGVATMVVVNSVMEGFTHEMQARIHGILSDVIFESNSMSGFADADWHMEEIDRIAGQYIEGMTPTVVVPGMLSYQYNGRWIPRPVQIIGIDPASHSRVGDFSKYLQHPANRDELSFELRDGGYDVVDHQGSASSPPRPEMAKAGWQHRLERLRYEQFLKEQDDRAVRIEPAPYPHETPAGDATAASFDMPLASAPAAPAPAVPANDAAQQPDTATPAADAPADPFMAHPPHVADEFDPAQETHPGAVIGYALTSYRDHAGHDRFLAMPGDDVNLSVPTAGTPPDVSHDSFTVVDFYESKMSEYDGSFVFVPLRDLQMMRGMYDRETGVGYVTSIQIQLKPGVDGAMVRDLLRAKFAPQLYTVSTWRDKQGPLLAAVAVETSILNVLLFMIIAVAGFGILAIFYMIVVEKTRDIGVLKSLGASGRGVMGIFLSYGLSLGIVGAGVGSLLGLLIVWNINPIANGLALITGREIFDPSIYYFQEIPTIVEPLTIAWIVGGALTIAVLASVAPARRASRLHPVEALRYE